MEKVIKKMSPKNFQTDLGQRILAVIIAIIIWFILSITQYPTKNKTITNIPVDFSMEGTNANEKGLSALNYKDITVDVEIKGMNYEIGNYSANDLVATVNLDEVSKEGTYTLDIDVKSAHSSDKVSVISVVPDTVEVSFDRIGTKAFDVSSEAALIKADEGLTLKDITVEPSSVEIEGAENELEKISKVVANVSKSMTISDDTSISTDKVIYYDADDNVLDSSKYTIKDTKTFDLSFVLYKKKTANFSVEFTDCPPGFDATSLPYEFSEESIQVISPKLDDDDTEILKLGSISLSNINLKKEFEFNIAPVMASGEINQTGIESVKVMFNDENYTSRTFTLTSKQIQTVNPPNGKSVTIETKQIPNVTIYGPTEVVNSLSASDLAVSLNLQDISSVGSYSPIVTIYAPSYNTVWCYGKYEIQIEVLDKVVSQSSSKVDS